MLKTTKLIGNEKMELCYFCTTCYRWFKTIAHFHSYNNKRFRYCPLDPTPTWRCKNCKKTYTNQSWARKHECKEVENN